jgi:hypothetical protein
MSPSYEATASSPIAHEERRGDGKTAILVFNRGAETSKVFSSIDATAKSHANFKRIVIWPQGSGFR